MKFRRKLIAAMLVVALVFSSFTAVFGADTSATVANADKAAALKDLGLYSGQDANDPKVGLENALTTQDSLIFLAKLFGYFESASALADDHVAENLAKFDDAASISDYAKNIVAYSAINGILNGITQDGKFFVGAKDTVTAARFATFMLKQMGYSVPDYKQSVDMLAETKGSKIDATLTGDLTRDAAVGMMYDALTAEKASGKTVIADIVGDNAALKKKAAELGLVIPSGSGGSSGGVSSQDLNVVSAKASNNKQIEIKFNLEMDEDSAQNMENYQILDKGTDEKTLTSNSCKLGADGKTVTITLDSTVQDCLTNDSTAKIYVRKDIRAMNEKTLGADKLVEIQVLDNIFPTVKEVTHTGEKHIKITFSEPVFEGGNNTKTLSTSNFAVKSGTYTYSVQKAELDLDVIELEVGTKLIEGPVTVTVKDNGLSSNSAIQDYAGYKVINDEHKFNYEKDTSAPVVTVKSASPNKVVLNLSKPVKGSNIKLYHSVKNAENFKAEVTTTDYVNELTFLFGNPLPDGTVKLFLVTSNELVDRYGIKVPDQTLTCQIVRDTAAPVIQSCIVNKNESIKITFNEKLDIGVAKNLDNYVLRKSSNNELVPFSVEIVDSMTTVELKFSPKLEDNTEYKLLIKRYQDIWGNGNELEYVRTFTIGDHTPPRVMDDPEDEERCFAIAEEGLIFILYSEPMNEAQMCDPQNYMVLINEGENYMALGPNDKVIRISDRIVKIFVQELMDKNDPEIRPSVKIAAIMDLAGKRLNGSIVSVTVSRVQPENVNIESAQLIAKNKIKVEFNKKIENFSLSDIELTYIPDECSTKVVACESNTLNSYGKTEVVLVLDKDLATDGKDDTGEWVWIITTENPSSRSVWGSKLRSNFVMNLTDLVAPEVVMWDHDNDEATDDIPKVIGSGEFADPQTHGNLYTVAKDTTGFITIYFSEAINDNFNPPTKDTFKVPGFTIIGIATDDVTNTIILEIQADADNTPVHTTVAQFLIIYDRLGNQLHPMGIPWAVTLDYQPPSS